MGVALTWLSCPATAAKSLVIAMLRACYRIRMIGDTGTGSRRTLQGGIDSEKLQPPLQFEFGVHFTAVAWGRLSAIRPVRSKRVCELKSNATLPLQVSGNQWRICFVWTKNGHYAVEIVDYH